MSAAGAEDSRAGAAQTAPGDVFRAARFFFATIAAWCRAQSVVPALSHAVAINAP
jgi:hypothetical protein